jgi:hypothetical protein
MTEWSKPDADRPPRMPAIQRVAEIFENLFVLEHALVGELLSELAQCTPEELAMLFLDQRNRSRATPAPALAAPVADEPEKPADPHATWRWDSTGKRIWPPKHNSTRRSTGHASWRSARSARTGQTDMISTSA